MVEREALPHAGTFADPRRRTPRLTGRRSASLSDPAPPGHLSQEGEDQNFHFAVQAFATLTMSGRFVVPARMASS